MDRTDQAIAAPAGSGPMPPFGRSSSGQVPTRATRCASVRKEPFTSSLPLRSLKTASSVFTLSARSGAEKKL